MENIYDLKGNIIGKVCGIYLRDYFDEKEKVIENFILAIERLKDANIDSIIFEDMSLFNRQDLKAIENGTNLKVLDGTDLLISFLPAALKKIYSLLGTDLKSKELLIIGDDEKQTKDLIESIYKEVGFITITGKYKDNVIDNIYKHILEKTGLSIFYSKNIDKILTNYSIIINLIDNYSIDFRKLRSETIVFDFSLKKVLRKSALLHGKASIEDFVFSKDNLNIAKNSYLPEVICSRLYESLNSYDREDLKEFIVNGEIYSVEEFVNEKIKNKGKL
ncbi:MAG TPA: hypothetical protein GXX53_03775 [Tissierellia bacterium]|nr:hypothetical protein [Tissierellia bacterium]